MSANQISLMLYVANLTVLVVHEIDSAYWHEWNLFGLPGGIHAFLIAHLVLTPIALFGLVEVAGGSSTGLAIATLLGMAGVIGALVHVAFLRMGRTEFSTVGSRVLIYAMLATSCAQLVSSLALAIGVVG